MKFFYEIFFKLNFYFMFIFSQYIFKNLFIIINMIINYKKKIEINDIKV